MVAPTRTFLEFHRLRHHTHRHRTRTYARGNGRDRTPSRRILRGRIHLRTPARSRASVISHAIQEKRALAYLFSFLIGFSIMLGVSLVAPHEHPEEDPLPLPDGFWLV